MGAPGFGFVTAEDIWDVVRTLSAGARGMTYSRLDAGGLQWPCPSVGHAGTPILHTETFGCGPRAGLRMVAHHPNGRIRDCRLPALPDHRPLVVSVQCLLCNLSRSRAIVRSDSGSRGRRPPAAETGQRSFSTSRADCVDRRIVRVKSGFLSSSRPTPAAGRINILRVIVTSPCSRITDALIQRVCGEFLEMPGLRLTRQQARRLWGLDEPTCRQVLDFLVDARFLARPERDGAYSRLTDGSVRPPRLSGGEVAHAVANPARLKGTA